MRSFVRKFRAPKLISFWLWLAASACVLVANTTPTVESAATAASPAAEASVEAITPSALPADTAAPEPVPSASATGATATAAAAQLEALNTLTLADVFGVTEIPLGSVSAGGATVYAAGGRVLRIAVNWGGLAPTVDTTVANYAWDSFDARLISAVSKGYKVILTLGSNPGWAASFSRGPVNCPGIDLTYWTTFVTAVVNRYSVAPYNVKFWEIYNEPDAADFNTSYDTCVGAVGVGFGDHPDLYFDMLEATYPLIKGLDPTAVVLLGGLSYDSFVSLGGKFTDDFLPGILALGAADYFDVMNFHYYPASDAYWEALQPYRGIRAKTAEVLDVLADYDADDKPLVITEMGASTGTGGATVQSQARNVVKYYARAIGAGHKVGIWYPLRDYSDEPPFGDGGLLDSANNPRLALTAYATMATELGPSTYVGALGPDEWNGASQMEGYVFDNPVTCRRISIVWNNEITEIVSLPPDTDTVTDKEGASVAHSDTLTLGDDPAFVKVPIDCHVYVPLAAK